MLIQKKNIYLPRLNTIEILLCLYLIVMTFFLRWYLNGNYIKYFYVLIVLYIFSQALLKSKRFRVNKKSFIINTISLGLILVLIILIGGNNLSDYFRSLISHSFGNLLILLFLLNLNFNKDLSLKKYITKHFSIIFNLYFLINIPVLIKQLNNTYFLMRHTEYNPYYNDHITGLIGQSGTHILTFYWIALTIINLYNYQKDKNSFLLVLIILEILFMVIISTYNDNTAFFYFFPLVIFQFYIKELTMLNPKRALKSIMAIIVILLGVYYGGSYLINTNQQFNQFFVNRIQEKFLQYTGRSTDLQFGGDEERIALFKYSLDNGNGYGFGRGIGSVTYGDYRLPRHFGMSEISIKTYEGGLIYLAIIIVSYAKTSCKMFSNNKNKFFKKVLHLVLIFNFLVMAIYTQVFSTPEIISMIGIILLVFNYKYSREEKEIKFERKLQG